MTKVLCFKVLKVFDILSIKRPKILLFFCKICVSVDRDLHSNA